MSFDVFYVMKAIDVDPGGMTMSMVGYPKYKSGLNFYSGSEIRNYRICGHEKIS